MYTYLPQSWGRRVLMKTQVGSVFGEELKICERNLLSMSSSGRRVEEVTFKVMKLTSQESHLPDTITLRARNPIYEFGEGTHAGNSTMLHWQNILVQCHLSSSFCKCRFPQSRTVRNWDQLHLVWRQDLKENYLAKYLLFPFSIFFCLKLSIHWLYIMGFLVVFSYVPIKNFDHMHPMSLLVPLSLLRALSLPNWSPILLLQLTPLFSPSPHPYVCIPGSFIKAIRKIWAPDQ